MYKMKYLVILLSTILAVKAYNSPQLYLVSSHTSKSHGPSIVQIKERGPTQVFNSETGAKPNYVANADMRQYSSQRLLTEAVERDRNNRYHSEGNREQFSALLLERSRKQHLEPELPKTSDASSYPIKYSLNKESSGNDRSYEYNNPARQSQSAYNDNTSNARHNLQLQSRVPQNFQHSHTAYAEGSPGRENNRNARHESAESNESSREYPRYYEHDEEVNKRPMHYSQHTAGHRPKKRTQLTAADNNTNHASYSKRQYEHQIQQHDLEHDISNRYSPPNGPSQYQQRDKIPTHSNYEEPRYSEEYSSLANEQTPLNNDSDYVPFQSTFSPSGHSDFRPSGHSQISTTDGSDTHTSHHRQNIPTNPHELKSKHSHHSSDVSNTPVSYNRQNMRTHLHEPKSNHYHKYPSNSNTAAGHKRQNIPTHPHESKSKQHLQSSTDHHTYRNHGIKHHEVPRQDTKYLTDQHDSMKQQSVSYREPTSHTEPSSHRESASYGPNNQPEPLANQHRSNAMRVVESKKDMKPLPSEVDSNLSEEHDGFLDMGAYTDKQGSFGWYADFPVGKEHDKVTYSFSK